MPELHAEPQTPLVLDSLATSESALGYRIHQGSNSGSCMHPESQRTPLSTLPRPSNVR